MNLSLWEGRVVPGHEYEVQLPGDQGDDLGVGREEEAHETGLHGSNLLDLANTENSNLKQLCIMKEYIYNCKYTMVTQLLKLDYFPVESARKILWSLLGKTPDHNSWFTCISSPEESARRRAWISGRDTNPTQLAPSSSIPSAAKLNKDRAEPGENNSDLKQVTLEWFYLGKCNFVFV